MEGVDHIDAVCRDCGECLQVPCLQLLDSDVIGGDVAILEAGERSLPGDADAGGADRSEHDV